MDTGQLELTGNWYGWRLTGRHLVSPDGDRITQERLTGLLWRDRSELGKQQLIGIIVPPHAPYQRVIFIATRLSGSRITFAAYQVKSQLPATKTPA